MSGTEIVNSVLKVAEKASRIDLEQAGKKAVETVKSLNAGTIVNAINVNSAERIERRTMATLDVAYLLANIDGWFTEKQESCFEKIAAAIGTHQKSAYLADRASAACRSIISGI